ncbi:hypothetical protein AMTR_s00001p00161700 [Amborella trichopoda]|uniref:Amine oxidase domain-containing protein n=1 Tax=Amborella trichopoda TaxID=13333 RepID=W1NLC3_AMBTC|nr:hypothetical protein AMTR_s00001p00161700 [Amborella trichopoda]
MWVSGVSNYPLPCSSNFLRRFNGGREVGALGFRADTLETYRANEVESEAAKKKKVVIVGSGWPGLGAAHHLSKQGFDVTLLQATSCSGSLVTGQKNAAAPSSEIGIPGFRCPYHNIFCLIDELGIQPFTKWTKSAQYSPEGVEVETPIFQDLPRLPTPLGALFYPLFPHLPSVDRLTSVPLLSAVIDFDNTDVAWRKYDMMTARELFKQLGCSERLYRNALNPLLLVGLFAPGEQCSSAATLGMLSYFFAHQQDFDVVYCRGVVGEKIFKPWMESIKMNGCRFLENRKVTDFLLDGTTGNILEVVCGNEKFLADSVVLALGISDLQQIIMNSSVLQMREEFLNVLNLRAIDVVTVRLWLDRKVKIPKASNTCSGFNDSMGWAFFDLTLLHDEYKDEPGTVIEADFYHANQFLPLKDEVIVGKVKSYLARCINEFEVAAVVDQVVVRFPKSVTHFFPGSYKYMLRGSTGFSNLFMAGDWIITRHGSWSQEKAYVTGLEAANRVIDYLGEGKFARIIAVEEDEPHVQALRSLGRNINDLRTQSQSTILTFIFFEEKSVSSVHIQ